MKKNTYVYNDEIDLLALFKIIYDGKIKILLITLILFLVGFGYNFQTPANYLNLLTINPYKNTEFLKLNNIQEMLKQNGLNSSSHSNLSNRSNQLAQLYLARFINELADYEEFLASIKNTKKIQKHFSKFNDKDQEIKLFEYAGLLEIVTPTTDEENYIINFIWHDPEERKKIIQDTLNLTSNNLKIDIINELNDALEFQKKLILSRDKIRLDYLKEQSAIAKELNILDNQIDNVNLFQSSVSLGINTTDIAYYLRGYKAIDKEIELIRNRKYKNFELIEREIDALKDFKINYVDYNVYLMETKSLKNTKLILIVSILSGFIIGVFFVLTSNVFQPQTASKKTR